MKRAERRGMEEKAIVGEEEHRGPHTRTPEEREKTIELLLSECGISRRDAELRLLDDDLWLLIPDSRIGLEPRDAVIEWHNTVYWMGAIANVAAMNLDDGGLRQLIWDARERAEEALRRAKKRAEQARKDREAEEESE
jgi:hypothetical protein